MPGYRYGSAIGERLARVLSDLGYASDRQPGALQIDRVCEVVNRQPGGEPITPSQMRAYIYAGKRIPLETAARLARALRFRLDEIAYEDKPPKGRYRRVKGWLDEVDPLRWK